MLLGRQGRREGFKGSLGRREGKGSLVPNVAVWNQENLQESARQVDMLLTLRAVPFLKPEENLQESARQVATRTCCWAAKGAGKGLRAA